MAEVAFDEVSLPSRKTVYSTYAGPKRGLGKATHLLYSWVGTYFKDQVGDVTVCFSDLAAAEAGPEAPIEIEMRFDVDEPFSEATRLPDGLEIKRVGPEILITHRYEGPLTGLKDDINPWLKAASTEQKVKPGYRQRMVKMAKEPTAPGWEVEVALVLDLAGLY